MVIYRLIILSLMLLALYAPLLAETIDDDPEVVSLYNRAKRHLREGDFLQASRIFEELSGRFPDSPNIDLIIYNRAKADYYFGALDKAQAGFANFANRFPNSKLYAHARFFQGNVNYSKGSVTRAVRNYIEAYRVSSDRQLSGMITEAILGAVRAADQLYMGESDFETLSDDKKCGLIEEISEILVARSDFVTAKRLAGLCGDQISIPNSQSVGQVDELVVGMVLPLSGEMQSFGEEIYNGAVIASEMYRAESGNLITLEAYDTKGDPINAARIVKQLAQSTLDCVIGPLTSEEAAVAAAAASCYELPLIAPAATQAGLTLLGESAFQLSPNIELQGIQMAEYAITNLFADSAAIITSTAADDLKRSKAFADHFELLGGEIIATQYYRSRDKDFGVYIRDIKAILLGAHSDSVYFINEVGDTLDPDGLPAHVDCIYLPGRARQLKQLLPQITFYNLTGAFLGSDDWGDETLLRLGDRITRQAVFPSPFLQGVHTDEYLKFAVEYDKRYGKQPQRLASLGYDAVRLLAKAAIRGGINRERLVNRLSEIGDFSGASGRISLGENRENVAMPVYRVENGQAVLLGVGDIILPDDSTFSMPQPN